MFCDLFYSVLISAFCWSKCVIILLVFRKFLKTTVRLNLKIISDIRDGFFGPIYSRTSRLSNSSVDVLDVAVGCDVFCRVHSKYDSKVSPTM